MRFYKIVVVFLLVLTCVKPASADLKLNSKKEKQRQQARLEVGIDEMVNDADHKFQFDDSVETAIDILKEAYFLADQANYTVGIIRSANLLGNGYLVRADLSNATSKFYISLRHAESINDSSSMSTAYRGLGLVKYNMKQWAEAISDFNKSMDYKTAPSDDHITSVMDYLLGLGYYHLGKYEVAETYLFSAKKAAESLSDSMRLLEIRLYLNNIEVERSNGPEVLATYDQLYREFEGRNEKIGMCYTVLGKAKSLLKKGDYAEASKLALESLKMARKAKIKYPLPDILEVAIETEYLTGNYKSSADLMLEAQDIKESTLSQTTSTQVAMMSADYDFEKKEKQFNDELRAKNKQRLLLLVLVIAFFIISIVVYLSLRGVAKERHRSDELLYNILPVETAKELKEHGVAVAKAHAEVTIVFADVQNFTKIAGDLEPTILVQLLDFYFGKFDAIIQSHGLEKIKTIGDAYMFVSGLNEKTTNNATNAVSAGIDMLSAIREAESETMNRFGAHFNFRIGMHTGKTVSGVVGKIKYAFDIWGDSVNIAARMEQNSEPGKINISEDTFNLVKDTYTCTPRGHIDVKNKGSMEMYFVEEVKA